MPDLCKSLVLRWLKGHQKCCPAVAPPPRYFMLTGFVKPLFNFSYYKTANSRAFHIFYNRENVSKHQTVLPRQSTKHKSTKTSHIVSCLSLCEPMNCFSNLSIYLRANKQTEQWRAPLTAGVANQRSLVDKLLNQVQKSFLPEAAKIHWSEISRNDRTKELSTIHKQMLPNCANRGTHDKSLCQPINATNAFSPLCIQTLM